MIIHAIYEIRSVVTTNFARKKKQFLKPGLEQPVFLQIFHGQTIYTKGSTFPSVSY